MSVESNGNCDRISDQAGRLAPFGLCRTVDLGDALSSKARVYRWGNLFIREVGSPLRSLNDPLSAGDQHSEFDLRPAAETLLPGAIFHLQRKTERVQTRVHRFVEYRRRHFGIREIRVHCEGQLPQARPLLVEVCPAARKALHDDICEISLEVPEVVRYEALDEG